MFTRNRHYLFILMTGVLITLSACTPPTPPPAPTSRPTPTVEIIEQTPSPIPTNTTAPTPVTPVSETTLVIWAGLPEAQTQTLAEHIQTFQNEYPQYQIVLHHYNQPEDLIKPLMAGEADFDVALVSPSLLGNLWATQKIAPMSDFFPASVTSDFAGVTLQGASRDNELWGLPDTAGFHLLLFYNRDLIDVPPATTTELMAMAQTLMTENSANHDAPSWGLAVNSYDPLWVVPWLIPYGGWLTDNTGQPTLNTPAMEAALTLFLGWQGRLTGIAPVATYEEVRHRFLNGDIAMLIDGEWAINELVQADKLNWGVAQLPNVGEPGESQPAAPLVLARYWVISRSTTGDQALASAAFLEYITDPERQLVWTTRFGLLPAHQQALDDVLIVNNSALRISAAQMRAGRTVPPGTNVDQLFNAMREPLRGVINGELTPQEAAELMQHNVEK